ncbi:MAG: transposase [Planctomycetaceae bacterium]
MTKRAEDHHRRRRRSYEAIVLDGKAAKAHGQRHQRAMMVVAAFDRATGCVLSQTPVDGETNEAKTALAMLKGHGLGGDHDRSDAAYCQHDVCKTITQNNGDYLLIVKANQLTIVRLNSAPVIPKDPQKLTNGWPPTKASTCVSEATFGLHAEESWSSRTPHLGHQDSDVAWADWTGLETSFQARTVCHCSW